jgi:hypothetical protein
MQQRIDKSRLSQIFKDAINIVRRLGLKYIWFDSLCIIQGDKQDWQREAAMKGYVYGNEFLNISADPDQGCFMTRNPARVQLLGVDSPEPQDGLRIFLQAMYSWDLWFRNVDRSPVIRRGWV